MRVFDLKAKNEEMLLGYARMGLNDRLDYLPDVREGNSDNEKYEWYVENIKKELEILREVGFDGYMLLLQDVVTISREISDFVECFGSITNSLTAYSLGITDKYKYDGLQNFINFTPFTKNARVNILISSYANNGCLGYIKHKYPDIIKKIKRRSIIFNDGLKIKFIDLDIDYEVDVEDLGELTRKLLKNKQIIK